MALASPRRCFWCHRGFMGHREGYCNDKCVKDSRREQQPELLMRLNKVARVHSGQADD